MMISWKYRKYYISGFAQLLFLWSMFSVRPSTDYPYGDQKRTKNHLCDLFYDWISGVDRNICRLIKVLLFVKAHELGDKVEWVMVPYKCPLFLLSSASRLCWWSEYRLASGDRWFKPCLQNLTSNPTNCLDLRQTCSGRASTHTPPTARAGYGVGTMLQDCARPEPISHWPLGAITVWFINFYATTSIPQAPAISAKYPP